ncbi:hypothetical protein CFP56_025705 [Quercus suber]|uniref:Uncharacterized protein n=1 Tax=Quercus suber TaxID=58331 RepID=A0AAW0K2N1_QUESU
MEEIIDRCAKLKLLLREDVEVAIQAPLTEEGLVLIGKFCTKRKINLESVARVLRSVWRAEHNFEVNDLGENKMVRGEAVKDIKYDRSPFWIQIHGLPTMCQTKEVG